MTARVGTLLARAAAEAWTWGGTAPVDTVGALLTPGGRRGLDLGGPPVTARVGTLGLAEAWTWGGTAPVDTLGALLVRAAAEAWSGEDRR